MKDKERFRKMLVERKTVNKQPKTFKKRIELSNGSLSHQFDSSSAIQLDYLILLN